MMIIKHLKKSNEKVKKMKKKTKKTITTMSMRVYRNANKKQQKLK